jgi:ATP-dependent Lon protease
MSLFRHRAIHQEMAMTGEVTLTGRVLPVGGVREKVLAARRAGITTVLIPRHNEKDLVELPAEVKADVTFHAIDTLDDVVGHLFPTRTKPTAANKPKPGRSKIAVNEKPRKPGLPPPAAKPDPPGKPTRRPRSV